MKRYFLCNKCGDTVLVTTSTGSPMEVCCNTMPVRTSRICGGAFNIELVPKVTELDFLPIPEENEPKEEGEFKEGQKALDHWGDNWIGDAKNMDDSENSK